MDTGKRIKAQVFDCQAMGRHLRSKFMAWAERPNDCYVEVYPEDEPHPDDYDYDLKPELLEWLIRSGWVEGEGICLIRHWW